MADLYLLPSEKKHASKDELRSVVTSSGLDSKARIANLLESLSARDISPQRTLETSRELASAVSQQLREQKAKPQEFRAVLNDVPAHARGALEDALKAVNVAPSYLAPTEKGDLEVLPAMTDKAAKRPTPVMHDDRSEPLDLRPSATPDGPLREELDKRLGGPAAVVRDTATVRANVEAVATAAREAFDAAGTPLGARSVIIESPAHLTGSLESALERQGIAVLHAQDHGGFAQSATTMAGAEQRGLKAVRDAFGAEGKGVSDNQIRQALGADRLQDLGRDPKALSEQAIEQALAARPETINESNRRVNAVLEAAQTVSRPPLALPRESVDTPEAMGPHKPAVDRAAIKELEPEPQQQRREPASVSTLDRGDSRGEAKPPTDAQIGTEMLRSYIATTSPGGISVKNGAKLEDGTRTYVGVVRDPTPNRIISKSGKVDVGWLVVDGFKMAMDKLEGRVTPPTEKEIDKHIGRDTLESFAKEGVPHRELDALSNRLAEAAERQGLPAPDKLDAVHLRQVAMDLRTDPTTVVRHNGQAIGTVGELRQELSKVNTLEAQAREQLRGVLPEKGFDAAFKQLDLRTVQDIAKNGVDHSLVSQVKAQMQGKASENPGWFKTADALNAISAARSGLSGPSLISTGATVAEGRRHEGAAVMVSVQDLRAEVATAVRTLGREKDWDVAALDYGETPKWSGGAGRANDGPQAALPDARVPGSNARTEPTMEGAPREAVAADKPGRTEPTLGSTDSDRSKADRREEAAQGPREESKERATERTDPERTERQEKMHQADQRQATFAREMTR
jgi:stage V sporulation protein SpoVS